MKKNPLLLITLFLSVLLSGTYYYKTHKKEQLPQIVPGQTLPPQKIKTPQTNISVKVPHYLDYAEIVKQCETWHEEAPTLTEVGTYGKSKQNQDLYYIRICNQNKTNQSRVLITSCIHGNEPWATGCIMGYIGSLLAEYGKNEEITALLDQRDIYFIPVVSPDSYPDSRHVDGVDPNRDFPGPHKPNHQSTTSVKALQSFFLKIKPQAVISGHTYGRVYLIPPGDTNRRTDSEEDYQRIIGKMAKLAKYGLKHCCEVYGRPIYGSEIDWYHRQGAFAIVAEYGTHQDKPSSAQIQSEFERTYQATILFIKEGPLVRDKPISDSSERTNIVRRHLASLLAA